ncbi:uncharacterized protein LOC121748305 [Salvia splendens]|uniref:uncharacterized protein LOC121748305 n=1 Tax=Salvia splendens TaxID=180675 RepID=UPI001C27A04E|nr:uncharacterized protein LOC121748305 [Salvia splendens]
MAFHVACPITCRKICFCALGFAGPLRGDKGKGDFLQEVARVEQFLKDPWLIKARENATVQVKVPKVPVSPALPPPPPLLAADVSAVGVGEEASAQVKRAALQKQAAAASLVAEDYARRFESGDLEASAGDAAGEEQGLSTTKVMCRICFSGENDRSERARKMLSCNSCGKKYHRSCLKAWSQNRDLFHWSSWTCPSCRLCEVCRRTGDPNKFMFCKRCDGAYHCYCQQPPHKNVSHGPYLCPKHTKCHSCDSTVPGNGLSVRWLLGYTCCDACGRLFGKGNYCPVCLKVYRDSESTPMVCCDICQRWVHCPCDGISDAKYMQFQVDGNLQYVCPTCRGECPLVTNLEEAVQELWKRRDEADKDLIASLRAAAGLPTQEEIFDISPFSDDEESGPISVKNEHGRSLKFSFKGLGNKSPRKSKEHGKKSSHKKYGKKRGKETSLIGGVDTNRSLDGYANDPSGQNTVSNKNDEMHLSHEPASAFYPVAGSLMEDTCMVNEAAASKHKYIDEVSATNVTKASRTIRIKSNKSRAVTNGEEIGSNSGAPKNAQGPKLVIHLGGRSKNTSPLIVQGKAASKGTEDTGQLKQHQEHIDRPNSAVKVGEQKGEVKGIKLHVKEGPLIKLKNASNLGLSNSNITSKHTGGGFSDGHESVSPRNTYSVLGKRSAEESASARSGSEAPASRRIKYSSKGHGDDASVSGDYIDDSSAPTKERKPYLKFKIPKNSNNGNQTVSSNLTIGNQDSLPPSGKDEITYTRGQRSKRRRPAPGDEDSSQWREDSTVKDFTDANWILQKLGKDAAGKRVEVHQPSSNSWHRGTVVEVFEGTPVVSIALDDGKSKCFELGKQGIRFISQKQKH